MSQVLEGTLSAKGLKVAVLASRFNDFICQRLLGGAMDALTRLGAEEKDITVVKVPGSWEIPVAAKKMAESKKYDALICVGAVIRGSTPHFDYVAAEVSKGIAQVGLETGVPVTFGVLTTDTLEQAIERAGSKAGNKGFDAAMAAVEMADLMKKL